MKKLFFLICFLGIFNLLIAGGKVIEIDGKVQFQKSGSDSWKDVKLNDVLNSGDKIKTLFGSAAIIKLNDGSNLTVSENTVIDMSSVGSKKKVNLKLLFGGLRANVKKRKFTNRTEFKVRTPTAVCGVRGTDFEVAETASDGSKFLVHEGKVEVESNGKKVLLKKNERVEVSSNGKIKPKQKFKTGESLLKLSEKIKDRIEEEKKELIKEENKLEKSDTEIKKVDDDTKPLEVKEEDSDTQNFEKQSRDTEVIKIDETKKEESFSDTKVVSPSESKEPSKEVDDSDKAVQQPVLPPTMPVLTSPQDGNKISENKITVEGTADNNSIVVLKINNAEISSKLITNGSFSFSNVTIKDGANKISVYAKNDKNMKSSEAVVNLIAILNVPTPQLTSPSPGSNFDRGAPPTINITSSNFLEWTKNNPVTLVGSISYNKLITLSDLKGKWITSQGVPVEGDISVSVSAAGEELEYSARSDASGNFSVSNITVNLPDEEFVTKISNDEISAPGGSFTHSWVLEQGENKLQIEAEEKTVSIKVKVKGRTDAGLESAESAYTFTSIGKTSSKVKEQKLDSLEPIIEVDPIVNDNRVRITVRDPEPTSGVYKVTAKGVSFKRVEGVEKDSEQVWEANLQIFKKRLPPPPPGESYRARQLSLEIEVTDRAENVKKETVLFYIYDDEN